MQGVSVHALSCSPYRGLVTRKVGYRIQPTLRIEPSLFRKNPKNAASGWMACHEAPTPPQENGDFYLWMTQLNPI